MVYSKNTEKSKTLKRRMVLKRGLSIVPNIFTLGNAFFGFCSIMFSAKGELLSAAYFILLGALMDALDGRIARLVGASSDFGVQLDSLADAVSFCLAPAVLIYFWQLKLLGTFGFLVGAAFLLAGLMRLARFNVIHQKQSIFFLGVPTTIAGCFLSIILLNFFNKELGGLFLIFIFCLVLGLSFLMVSSIRFPTFKQKNLLKQKFLREHKSFYAIIFIILFAIVSILRFHMILLLLFLLYFSTSVIFALFFKEKNNN